LVISGWSYLSKLTSIRRLFVGSRFDLEAMIKAIAARKLRPVFDRVFPSSRLPEAYTYFQERNRFGKVVIGIC
jgi:NADPH:quinone reductase-like Zn-dependent oxidoreductase